MQLQRIHTLSSLVANQIAAGEVVERPASVLKELLENSLDAGARRIEVDLEEGGLQRIEVRDDGCGIHPDDLGLAVVSHATSKIHDSADLEGIATLGFRGEALASIASVCRFQLASRCTECDQGWMVTGTDASPKPIAQPSGTRVESRDLFYNVPGRRKFLRSPRTEYLHAEEVVKRMAVSHFHVAFSLRHNDRRIFSVTHTSDSPEARRQRVAAVLGHAFLATALAVEFAAADMRLWGWLGEPDTGRAAADQQYLFVNGRIVRDRLLNHAIRQAYGEHLPVGRHASYLLYLGVPPAGIDVNVHPTKHEVRFREARMVHDFVLSSLSHALENRQEDVTEGELPHPPLQDFPNSSPGPDVGGELSYSPRQEKGRGGQRVDDTHPHYREKSRPDSVVPNRAASYPGRYIGSVGGRYLLLEQSDALIIIDGLAAARDLALQRLKAGLAEGNIRSKPLLIPVVVPLASPMADHLEEQQACLSRCGVEIGRLDEQSIAVRRVPTLFGKVDVVGMIDALVEAVAGKSEIDEAALLIPIVGALEAPSAGWSREESADLLATLSPDSPHQRHLSLHQIDALIHPASPISEEGSG